MKDRLLRLWRRALCLVLPHPLTPTRRVPGWQEARCDRCGLWVRRRLWHGLGFGAWERGRAGLPR